MLVSTGALSTSVRGNGSAVAGAGGGGGGAAASAVVWVVSGTVVGLALFWQAELTAIAAKRRTDRAKRYGGGVIGGRSFVRDFTRSRVYRRDADPATLKTRITARVATNRV